MSAYLNPGPWIRSGVFYDGREIMMTPRELMLSCAAAEINARSLAALADWQAKVDAGWDPFPGGIGAIGRGNDWGRPHGRHQGWGQQ